MKFSKGCPRPSERDGSERRCALVALGLTHRMTVRETPDQNGRRNAAHPQLGLEIQQLKVRQLSHVPASRPKTKQKTKKPTKTWAKVLTAMTRQSSSASAKQRKGESNHQNWSPSNPMMLFIAPGVLCSVQQTSKTPLTALCMRGTGEVWRGPVQAPAAHAGVHRLEVGRAGNARPEHPSGRGPRGACFLQGHTADL